jgi:hypothetical protein
VLGENGIFLAGQLRDIPSDMLMVLGVPLDLIRPIALAMNNHLEDEEVEDEDVKMQGCEEFDVCKLCRNPFAEGPKEMLDCLHVFCKSCLKAFIEEKITKKEQKIQCVVCSGDISQAIMNVKHRDCSRFDTNSFAQ